MNLANRLTMVRVVFIPIFLFVLYANLPYANILSAIIFILASITDFLDGYIARKYNLITDLGKFLDPLADKLLVMSALLYLMDIGHIHGVIAILVLAREFVVTALRTVAMGQGVVMAAAFSGKVKTAVQMVCLIVLLFDPAFLSLTHNLGYTIINLLLAGVTLWSGADYFISNRFLFSTEK